jgi:hypothetical protein
MFPVFYYRITEFNSFSASSEAIKSKEFKSLEFSSYLKLNKKTILTPSIFSGFMTPKLAFRVTKACKTK